MKVSNIIIDVHDTLGRPIFLWTLYILGRGEILLKKNMNVKKKMKIKLVKENDPIESLKLYLILLKNSSTQRQQDIEVAINQYDQNQIFNPKYSEEIIPLKEVILKVYSSDIVYSSRFNIFRNY